MHQILDGLDIHHVDVLSAAHGRHPAHDFAGTLSCGYAGRNLRCLSRVVPAVSHTECRCGGAFLGNRRGFAYSEFCGQQETYLNVRGEATLLESIKKCFASLFTPWATSYRADMGFGHFESAFGGCPEDDSVPT